ncbi:hypothetical protein NKJ06_05050 [Mesorhizobium sp. M0293]
MLEFLEILSRGFGGSLRPENRLWRITEYALIAIFLTSIASFVAYFTLL